MNSTDKLAALTVLAQAKRHNKTTLTPASQTVFATLRLMLTEVGVDVDRLVDKILDHEVIEIEALKICDTRVNHPAPVIREVKLSL